MVIFSGVILVLAGMAFHIARRSTRATDQALVMGVLLSTVDRVAMTPFDSLPTLTGCDSTLSGVINVIACVNVWTPSPRRDSIRIIVRTTVPGTRPDTVIMKRSRWRAPVPLR